MDVSSQDSSLLVMDLSKGFSVPALTPRHTEAKKPEWYHRRPSSEISPSYRSRPSSSYNPLEPGPHVLCGDIDQSPESLGDYMNSTLNPRLELYRDGVHSGLWHQGFYGPDQTGGAGPESSGGEESDSGSDVIFLVSSSKEPLLCGPFIQDGVRHIVEPLSPAVSSLDGGRGCCHLPQPLSSPSPESSYSDESSDSSVDIPVHHARPVVLLSDLSSAFRNPAESMGDVSSEDSDVIEVSGSDEKKKKSSLCKRMETEDAPNREVRRSSRIRKSVSEFSVSLCSTPRSALRRRAKNDAVGIYNESGDSDDLMEYAVRLSSSDADESLSQQNDSQRQSCNSDESETDVKTKRTPVKRESPPTPCRESRSIACKRKTPQSVGKTKEMKKSEPKQKSRIKTVQSNKESVEKKTPVKRRRKKRCSKATASNRFPPSEPEIKFRYVNIRAEKKEKKSGSFQPFIHLEQRSCTVINYREEEETMKTRAGRLWQTGTMSLSGFVPNSSCFQLSRPSSESQAETSLRCCLCGETANTMSLGDLHGPYVPVNLPVDYKGQTQKQEQDCETEQKQGVDGLDNSDSVKPSTDSLFCSAGRTSQVSPHLDESWIHEDCGIWSTGVFLVRGKLYGLLEAAQLAQRTLCSACSHTGAIMGCFQKSCPSNYHYRCAIQSGCVLNEENFSVLCPEHKNKWFTRMDKRRRR
ncbi:transcription factor 20-like [Notolabrus celidotus]|uniref:transcription factor 20-like n=1 Tax=Notolabrus celidotus TaxID=1203425 RepID=UPI00149015F3|nr:transcription factor 20-like [Notolabrus celidotus]XP_034567868.1 transcription factor 20-like [Notolabrus celidotus]XP_034567870.1 transcription factor 20-like [Notolabrus celidotus]